MSWQQPLVTGLKELGYEGLAEQVLRGDIALEVDPEGLRLPELCQLFTQAFEEALVYADGQGSRYYILGMISGVYVPSSPNGQAPDLAQQTYGVA